MLKSFVNSIYISIGKELDYSNYINNIKDISLENEFNSILKSIKEEEKRYKKAKKESLKNIKLVKIKQLENVVFDAIKVYNFTEAENVINNLLNINGNYNMKKIYKKMEAAKRKKKKQDDIEKIKNRKRNIEKEVQKLIECKQFAKAEE